MWHLSKQGHVVVDCPKMAEALWPCPFQAQRALAAAPDAATAPAAAAAPEPSAEQTGGAGGAESPVSSAHARVSRDTGALS